MAVSLRSSHFAVMYPESVRNVIVIAAKSYIRMRSEYTKVWCIVFFLSTKLSQNELFLTDLAKYHPDIRDVNK